MDLSQLANLGEFIGGVAVLVTLVYLAFQVRQGNQLERRHGEREFSRHLDRVFFEPMRDPQRSMLLQRAAGDFDSLDNHEQCVVNAVWSPMFMGFQEVHQLSEDGMVGPWEAAMESFVASFLQMHGSAQWWSQAKVMFPPVFSTYIDGLIASPERPPPLDASVPWFSDRAGGKG